MLLIGESVIASEPSDGLALLGDVLDRGMRGDRIPQLLQFAVEAAFGQSRLEGKRVKKDVDVLENR
jgi:hypothetical protein